MQKTLNAQKSINALELLLASPNKNKSRAKEAILGVLKTIQIKLTEIQTAYQKPFEHTAYLTALINKLIASSHKLSAWRINEPAGFSPKPLNKANPTRLYPLSQHSLIAMKAILALHKSLINSDSLDLKDLPNSLANPKLFSALQQKLDATIKLATQLTPPLATKLTSPLYKKFAAAAKDWHQAISTLPFGN